MPFACKFRLNNGALEEKDEVLFLEFIDDSFGSFHNESIQIAKVQFNGKQAYISSTCPCFPSSKNKLLEKGVKLNTSTVIGYFSANGEDIPYDKPYSKITF